MLQSDLVTQQKTAAAVREEGERIMRTQTSDEASSATQASLQQLNNSLFVLESRLSDRIDQMTAALSQVRQSSHVSAYTL